MSHLALPVELYQPIVREPCLERKDLYNLCLSSRTISSEAYLVLYRSITLATPEAVHSVIIASTRTKSLLLCVQELHIYCAALGAPGLLSLVSGFENLKQLRVGNKLEKSQVLELDDATHRWSEFMTALPSIHTLIMERDDDGAASTVVKNMVIRSSRPIPVYVNLVSSSSETFGLAKQVFCTRLGHLTLPSRWLKTLVLMDLTGSMPAAYNTIPTLETVVVVGGTEHISWGNWIDVFPAFRNVKKLGPIRHSYLKRNVLRAMSELQSLEVILFQLATDGEFELEPEVRVISDYIPTLQRIAVYDRLEDYKKPNGVLRIWDRIGGKVPTADTSRKEWMLSTVPLREWMDCYSVLLDEIPLLLRDKKYWKSRYTPRSAV